VVVIRHGDQPERRFFGRPEGDALHISEFWKHLNTHFVASFDDSVAERVSASDVVRQAAAIVGGGGGGRPTMARAGGKDPEKLPDALAEAERLILAAL